MLNPQILIIVADLVLLACLVALVLRSGGSLGFGKARRDIDELQVALRELIKEAEVSGNTLNEELIKRQGSIEKLLFDIQSAENRLDKAVIRAEGIKQGFEAWGKTINSQSKSDSDEVEGEVARQDQCLFQSEATNKSNVGIRQNTPIESTAPVARRQLKKTTNIYGEEIKVSDSSDQGSIIATGPKVSRQKSSLSNQVEVMSVDDSRSRDGQQANSALNAIYRAAHNLLSAGKDLKAVSAATKIPIPQLEKLLGRSEVGSESLAGDRSNSIQEDIADRFQAGEIDSETDPRLGVLAGVKRESLVL